MARLRDGVKDGLRLLRQRLYNFAMPFLRVLSVGVCLLGGCTTSYNLQRQQQTLLSPDPAVHGPAANTFFQRSAEQRRDVLRLLAANNENPDPRVRKNAIQALGRLGPEAREEIPTLLQALRDTDGTVRREASDALVKVGKHAAAPIAESLSTAEPAVAGAMLQILGELGPYSAEAVPAVAGLLGNPVLREPARATLTRIGEGTEEYVTQLREQLESNDQSLRRRAVEQLTVLGPLAASAIPDLIAALADDDPTFHQAVEQARVSIGPPVPRNAPLLMALLDQTTVPAVKRAALATLCAIDPIPRAALPVLQRYARDPDPVLRLTAAYGLFQSGTSPGGLSPLVAALSDSDAAVRAKALQFLGSAASRGQTATTEIVRRTKDTNARVREQAIRALMHIKPSADVVSSHYRRALGDRAAAVREAGAEALSYQPITEVSKALPQLVRLIDDPSAGVRLQATKSVSRLGKKAGPKALKALKRRLKDSDPLVKDAAARAIQRVQGLKVL